MSLPRILCVDDEQRVLEGLQRVLFRNFQVEVAGGPRAALDLWRSKGPFPVMITDYRMPELTGLDLISQVKRESPQTVCLLLTGQADVQAAIRAVNEGNLFRFLTKPTTPENLIKSITDAVEQHRLLGAERDVMQSTLTGVLHFINEVLVMANPVVFGRGRRLKRYVRRMVEQHGGDDTWHMELAAMMGEMGRVTLPHELLEKERLREALTDAEKASLEGHYEVPIGLLRSIPRLEPVAAIIDTARGRVPASALDGDSVQRGALFLTIARAVDEQVERGLSLPDACDVLAGPPYGYPASLLQCLKGLDAEMGRGSIKSVDLYDLEVGMVLDEDVRGKNGVIVVSKHNPVTPLVIERLRRFGDGVGIVEPIRVFVPG